LEVLYFGYEQKGNQPVVFASRHRLCFFTNLPMEGLLKSVPLNFKGEKGQYQAGERY